MYNSLIMPGNTNYKQLLINIYIYILVFRKKDTIAFVSRKSSLFPVHEASLREAGDNIMSHCM